MSAENSAEELQGKLSAYKTQLTQIESILQTDPENQQFVKLRDDLSMLIGMTQKLYDAAAVEATEDTKVQGSTADTPVADVFTEAATSSSASAPLKLTNAGATAVQAADAAFSIETSREASGMGAMGVGDVVLVSGGERPYAGYITATVTNPDLPGGRGVRVKYYEFPDEVELPWSIVARIPQGEVNVSTRNSLVNDWQGQCKYGPDQRYYSVRVTALTAFGAIVVYPDFSGDVSAAQSEEVPLAYLRPNKAKASTIAAAAAATAAAAAAAAVAAKATSGSSAGAPDAVEIPDKYQLKDTDTPAERSHKLKKIKSIKLKNKEMTKESEVMAVQQSWKKFVSHGGKRNLQGIVKSSMFSSANAGQEGGDAHGKDKDRDKMTNYDKRKKHKF